jgi:hypothetical protein
MSRRLCSQKRLCTGYNLLFRDGVWRPLFAMDHDFLTAVGGQNGGVGPDPCPWSNFNLTDVTIHRCPLPNAVWTEVRKGVMRGRGTRKEGALMTTLEASNERR